MGTVSCCEGLSVNGSRGSKMVAQVLSMGKELDANPHPLLMQTWNEPTAWSCRTDGWLVMKWNINCKLIVVQPMKVSTTGMPSMKSVHDGPQSISQNCTKRNNCTSANGFWIAMVLKVTTSWKESSLEIKSRPTITNQRINTKSMEWKHCHSPTKKNFKTHSTAGKLMLTVFGTLSKEDLSNEQFLATVWWVKACSSKPMKRTTVRKRCVVERRACPHTAVHTVEIVRTLLSTLLKSLRNQTSRYLDIPCIVLTLPLRSHLFGPLETSLKRPSVYHGPATDCNNACVTCLSAQNILFWGHKADCAVMDKVQPKARGLCWKIM